MMSRDWLLQSAFMPFHLCVVAIFILIITETLGIYIGHRPSNLIRKIIPLWIKDSPIFRVKISRYFVLLFFLINLSFAGYFIQLIFFAFKQHFINSGVVFIPAFMLAWFFTLFMLHCLDQVIKPNQKVDQTELIGRFGIILYRSARPDASTEASVRDQFGQLHRVQVVPEFGELEPNSQVILIDYHEHCYIAHRITPLRDV
ncbi:hypothetical protein BJI46_08870 [Acinetobacter qingfengensis]|uniref:Inner membrane protein YqiJ OB-fold domain-containing protein n=2 Tax=Acinetobacter qingfengensis TaxID=1262585 RepID=A0A1E7RE64_9GAMM|nr:hypothetical protein BJI46_08870 [Acinetobacter qingfengensis]